MVSIITELWTKQLQPFISVVWGNVTFLRFVALIALTLLFALGAFLYKNRRKFFGNSEKALGREHDIKLFNKLSGLLSEDEINIFLNTCDLEHATWGDDLNQVKGFLIEFEKEENSFINVKINNKAAKLKSQLDNLISFVGQHFFSVDNREPLRGFYYKMYPEMRKYKLDMDVELQKNQYKEYTEQLNAHLDSTQEAYKNYRKSVKENLFV